MENKEAFEGGIHKQNGRKIFIVFAFIIFILFLAYR